MCFIKPTYTYLHGARLMVMSAWCTLDGDVCMVHAVSYTFYASIQSSYLQYIMLYGASSIYFAIVSLYTH